MAACRSCGKENEAGARFCSACGAELAAEAPREVRKTVTILFCDVTGSTALGERLDPEATRKLMARYFETARGVLERHGASVEKFIGDAVMAVFGIPQVHEDDALRAARAALELRDAVTELELRIGVNTGQVVAGTGETLVTGDPVNIAARLEQAAAPGEILLGDRTYRLVRDAVEAEPIEPVDAKGKSEPLAAHRLVRVFEGAAPFARRLDSPLVGRERELAQLEHAYARAVGERACHLFTLLGAPGIGKSRLSQEFIHRLDAEAMVVGGRCLSYGEGITYWPLVEILRTVGDAPDVARLLRGELNAQRTVNDVFVGVGLAEGSSRPEETNRATRKLFEALARERPLIVVLDDLQWAESTFLDLVEHIADLSRDAPILLLCLARPDLLDARPGWSGGKHNATTLLLEPLSDEDADVLMRNLLADTELADAVRARISSAAEGNPLFVEQMLAMLGEDGADGEVLVPGTIQALLAARLDRLEPDERELLERASVVGKEFWERAVADLGADPALLPALVRKELIRPHVSRVFASDDAYRFRHQLVRDAAYDSIPKELRADLHERFADWLQHRLSEYDEIVGHHLEQAYRYRCELGDPDEHARELGERAGRLLGAAGLRAAERYDVPSSINLLTRAVDLMAALDERRLEFLVQLGVTYQDANAAEQAGTFFAEAFAGATQADLPVVRSRATVGRLTVSLGGGGRIAEALAAGQLEITKLTELDDPRALAEAYGLAGKIEAFLGHTKNADQHFEKAIAEARRGGSRRLESEALTWSLALQCHGYLPSGEGLRLTETLLQEEPGGILEAFVHFTHGCYRVLRGDLDGARAELEGASALVRELGADFYVAGRGILWGHSELGAGHPAVAETVLRQSYEMLQAAGAEGFRSTAAAMLAQALVEEGKLEEAERLTEISEQLGAADDAQTQIVWRSSRARILARRGEIPEAEALARQAVELAARTDFLQDHAQTCLDLAEVLALAGRADEGRPAIEEAILLFDRKEIVGGAARARARLRDLAAVESARPSA